MCYAHFEPYFKVYLCTEKRKKKERGEKTKSNTASHFVSRICLLLPLWLLSSIFLQKHTSNAALILRTPCIILRHSLPLFSSSLTAKPISRNSFSCTLRASPSPTQKHVYPDPSPQFAQLETHKFKVELLKKLSEDVDEFGDDLDAVVDVCAQIFNEFLSKEYGGPGTLLVEPFTDMLVALKRKKLPGAPLAARASLLWAQNNVDEDWEVWNSKPK